MASIRLPFPGFYESAYSGEVDYTAEREAEYLAEKEVEERPKELRLTRDQFADVLFDVTDYSAAYHAIAKDYVETFNDMVSDALELPLDLKFEELTSPRFYNFETDRVFASISDEAVSALFLLSDADHHKALGEVIKDRHTSYDGFHSFYSNDLETWLSKSVQDWDHNELETLLLAVFKLKGIDPLNDIFMSMAEGEAFYHAHSEAVDWVKFDAKVEELRADLLTELHKDDPDFVEPPKRCALTPDLFEGRR